jgi:hypothetical protein
MSRGTDRASSRTAHRVLRSWSPADRVLAELSREGTDGGMPVFAIEFHVDYWDELGWPDRFASPEHTSRQYAYRRAFGTRSMYTPQMIVDGREEFVGSDRDRALDSVRQALARPATATVSLQARPRGGDAIAVDYDVSGAPTGAVLTLVAVDRSASVTVRAGENAGRTLHHTDVARALVTVPLGHPAGTQVLHVPSDAMRDAVIAFVQVPNDPDGMPILGAARATLR